MAEVVPVDAIIEILLRLAVKTLSKFECVSKSWCNLISDPQFQRLYHERSKQNLHYFFVSCSYRDEENKLTNFCLASMDINDGKVHDVFTEKGHSWVTEVMPTHLNLICFATFGNAYLCNPSTRELVSLPDGSPSVFHGTAYGFGYVPSTKEYKVVRLFYRHMDQEGWEDGYYDYNIGCEIFTFNGNGNGNGKGNGNGNGWRVIEERCPYPVSYLRSAFVNGALHWVVFCDCNLAVDDNKHIVSFDLENEKFRILPHPEDCLNITESEICVVELKEKLCIVDNTSADKTNSIMEIWMLKDYENCIWVKEYRIDLRGMEPGITNLECIVPFCVRIGEIIMNSSKDRLDHYNIEKGCFRRVNKHHPAHGFALYWESFVSLGSI